MANGKDSSEIKAALERDTRDVADLWKDALRKYKGVTGLELQPTFNSTDDMLKFGTEQMMGFHKFRHDQKKVDKLRSLFSQNMGYIELGSAQLISAASAAFPPAAAIGLAMTFLLQASKSVSADYDVVTAFFEDMNAFLQRIKILEARLPSYPAYRNCLMDVFTSFLTCLGFATKFMELGRFKKWAISAIKLGAQDGDLAGARQGMDTAISRLQSATEFAILGNTEKLQDLSIDLKLNEELQTKMIESQSRVLDNVLGVTQEVQNDLRKLLAAYEEKRRDEAPARNNKASSRKKAPTSLRVRSYFSHMLDPQHEYESIKYSLVPETGTWPVSEAAWKDWFAEAPKTEKSSLPSTLAISGPPGSGKSHLAVSLRDHLFKLAEQAPDSDEVCVTQYYFRETTAGLDWFLSAIYWTIIQIAEQSPALCEKISASMDRDEHSWYATSNWKSQDWWNNFILPFFDGSTRDRLYIIWDGLDELNPSNRTTAMDFFKFILKQDMPGIRFLCTTRPAFAAELKELGAVVIDVTPEKQAADVTALIWNHLNNDSALRKLSRYMKQRIASALEDSSAGMLHNRYMLAQFNATGREPLILRTLNAGMPKTLQDLYESMLSDLQHHLRTDQLLGVRILLCWMAYSARQLTVNEHEALLRMLSGDSLDLERDLQDPYLARFLRIADFEERWSQSTVTSPLEISLEVPDNSDAAYQDGDLPLKFQGRSMRDFFRRAKADDTLRTPYTEGHRRIFVFCSRVNCGILKGVHPGLVKYAAGRWLWHLTALVRYGDIKNLPEDAQITLVEAVGAVINDQPNAAAGLEHLSGPSIIEKWYSEYDLTVLAAISQLAQQLKDKIDSTTRKWADDVVLDKKAAYVPLAKGHIMRWFRADDYMKMFRSYRFARALLPFTNLSHLVRPPITEGGAGDDEWSFEEKEIINVFNAFEDIPKDAAAYRAVATLLSYSGHDKAALGYIKQASKLASDHSLRLEIDLLTVQIMVSLKKWEETSKMVAKVTKSTDKISPKLMRQILVAQAQAEFGAGRFSTAVEYYQQARKADAEETMPGDLLHQEFNTILKLQDPVEVVNVLKEWKIVEIAAWMTWNYSDSREHHFDLQRAANRCGQQELLVGSYEEIIKILDRVDSSVPIKYQLAIVHWRGRDDLEAAKSLLNEILDTVPGTSYYYALTQEDPATVFCETINLLSLLIYRQFREAADPTWKLSLYTEMNGLTQKRMAHSTNMSSYTLLYYSLTKAKMTRKMAGAQEYQNILQSAFDVCYEALSDDLGWNDSAYLENLAIILSQMNGLQEEARIAASCKFSTLDKNLVYEYEWEKTNGTAEITNGDSKEAKDKEAEADEDGDEDEDAEDGDEDEDVDEGEDYPLPEDEGDLADNLYTCDGECEPYVQWRAWRGRPMYVCTICPDVALCKDCHAKRLAYNAGTEEPFGDEYCGKNHEYIQGPIEGWKGVFDGVIQIEGKEPISFKDWLEDLKTKKMKEAWDRFWLAED